MSHGSRRSGGHGGNAPALPPDDANRAAALEVLAGGDEMGALMRSMDWSKTPLGPVASWPQSLRTIASVCLTSGFPMMVFWGPQAVKLYNGAYSRILGGKHPAAMGRPGHEVWAEVWDEIGPWVEQVRSEGRAIMTENQRLFMERNGFLEETYFTFSYSPVRDESGAVNGVLDTVVETTSQVLDARRLRTLQEVASRAGGSLKVHDASTRGLEALATNPADLPFALLYLVDADGARARLEGRMGLEGDGAFCPKEVGLEPGAASPWPLAQVIRSGQAERVQGLKARFGPLPLRAGVPQPGSALVLPMARPGESNPLGVIVLGMSPRLPADASYQSFLELVAGSLGAAIAGARAHEDARRQAEALAELDRAKTAFFSNVSHEFRTPLTLMLGPLGDVLADVEHPLEPAHRERLAIVQRNSQRLHKLVNSLLDFSRLEAGRMRATFEPTDLGPLTAGLASAFDSLVKRAGLRLQVDCPPLSTSVWVDRDLWEKVVLNLLSNAFKFTFQGTLTVRLRERDGRVELSVSDTGTGIPTHELPRVFDRFHRVEGAKGRSHEGSGIGLALVRELVELHGGRVAVESTPGRGSTFTVSLPTGTAHLPPEQLRASSREAVRAPNPEVFVNEAAQWLSGAADDTPAPVPEAPPGVVRGHVLVADDNADMRDYVRRSLEGRFQVTTVADGNAALELARRHPPDVVLSDVMMPGLDGFGLLRALKSDPRTAHVPVILLSARAGEEAKVEGLTAGADDYLVKPFGVRELVARLEGTVNAARARAQREELLQALKLSETRYRLATRATKDAVWDLDLSTQQLTWSEGVHTLFGYPLDAVPPELDWWTDAVHPEDRAQAVESLHAIVDSPGGSDWRAEYRFRKADGTYAQVEDRGWVVRDATGTAIRMVGAMQDVTLRKAAADALRRSEEEFRTLAEALPEAVFVTAPDGSVVYVNGVLTEETGVSAETLLDRGYRHVIHPDDLASSGQAWVEALTRGDRYQAEHRVRYRDGLYRWHLVRAMSVKDAEGRVIKWVGTSMDVHELRQAQAQQQQRADFEQQLIGIVSHDLRNPVSAILLGAASLMRREELDERSTKAVSRIQSAAERAHRMIRDLLDFTQARLGGGLHIQRRASDLHEIVDGVLEEIEATHPDREIRRRRSGSGLGAWDPDRLGQLAQNLVTNALKYSPRDTAIQVETHGGPDAVTLSIHNAGAPISPERMSHLFQPLQRPSGEVDHSSRSIGLGLYIVKQLVKAHGGIITVESTDEAGTTFTVRLPRDVPASP
ncbi:PAS domain S-box protein [Corallococcus sp. AB032C]|uniref:ATP-binding protein n=1 Tax=Corallococcus TaxID=83461 RepID=UPI000ED6C98D|nr:MULTISPECIES: ATP-binding protein [Corallococcus]NPC52137.1 PAS domain-containing protein [Corallococcus exiguus]RKH78246.1 PAS domain S-box protein [Corallococcus sp. AB032C]